MLYSTENKSHTVSLKQAVLQSLAPDKGLYMPAVIPALSPSFLDALPGLSIQEIAYIVGKNIIGSEIPDKNLREITEKAINFPAPVIPLDDHKASLELWHGPSLAFKDFGARYMAQMMSWMIRGEDKELTILVATSGDTGGAVAAGFLNTPGIEVIILYPSGKVSPLQEKQLTALGGNISALEIQGTFDDCQALVKTAFLDDEMNQKYHLSSANSINIARLIPQCFYYFEAFKQVAHTGKSVVFSVPSGNFGNLTAGLMAKKMGLPVRRFIASTNINKIVPEYLETGFYRPRPSIPTISNAMDVGNPSNFIRILDLYQHDFDDIRRDITGFYLDDENTFAALRELYEKYKYIGDPHGAIAYKSLDYLKEDEIGIFLETANPAKFPEVVKEAIQREVEIPERLKILATRKKVSTVMSKDFNSFKEWMMQRNRP